MKTVCVFATIQIADEQRDVFECALFGENEFYITTQAFIVDCQELWRKTTNGYKITNVVIEG